MHVTAILLAAGRGKRLKSHCSKALVAIGKRPLILWSLKTLNQHRLIRDIVVVVNASNAARIRALIKGSGINKVSAVVRGGKERQDSVRFALNALDAKTDFVLIHDAARPFIGHDLITRLIQTGHTVRAAVAGVAVKATIKQVTRFRSQVIAHSSYGTRGKAENKCVGVVEKTLDRSRLWEIQTPQVFQVDLLRQAYARFGRETVTDDAMLVEKTGAKVRVVMGSYRNIKITTPEDVLIAEALAELAHS
jgi:2-C-methyl-D-erythritol 4-phosphate cytidylyltransferase